MHLNDRELNISSEVSRHFGFGRPVRRAQDGRNVWHPALAIDDLRRRDAGRAVVAVIGTLTTGILVLLACVVLVGFISFVTTAVNRSQSSMIGPETASGARPQIRRRASRSARQEHLGAKQSSAYLPAEYSTGRLAMPIWLHDQMPRGSGVNSNLIALMPEGTDLFLERENINGWRRVVSYDGRYAGYAMVFPTVPFEPQAMQPYYAKLISRIRRIP